MGEPVLDQHSGERRERRDLADLRLALEVGSCGVLKARIDKFGPRLATSASPEIVSEYEAILRQAEQAFEIERVHGPGSFLNLDHPMVARDIEWVRNGGKESFPKEMVAAAERYRAIAKGDVQSLQLPDAGTDRGVGLAELPDEPLGSCPPEVEVELNRRMQEAKDGHSLTIEEHRELLRALRQRHAERTTE